MSLVETIVARWNRFLFTGYSAESLGALRVCLGAGYLLFLGTQFYSFLTIEPAGAHWVFSERVWYVAAFDGSAHTPAISLVVLGVLFVATLSMTLGCRTHISVAVVLLASVYLRGIRDSMMGDTHHRLYLWGAVFFFLLLSPCNRAYALDARHLRGEVPEWSASWPIKAMQLYTVSFYFWSFLAKLRVSGGDWAAGAKLQEMLLRRSVMWGLNEEGEPVRNALAFHLAHHPALLAILAVGVLLLEASFPAVLFLRSQRVRVAFLLVVTTFHLVNFVLLYVGFVLMPLLFVIFVDVEPFVQRVVRFVQRGGRVRVPNR
ncbi:MAG: HTTM domain-containing protein [Myxococcota bacterium]